MPGQEISIYSWNVNGLRAAARKGFFDWLKAASPDLVGVQEVRATEQQLEAELALALGYEAHIVSAERKGYSGVGFFSQREVTFSPISLGEEFDREGRLQEARLGQLRVINGYFPNGNGPNRDNSRVPYKVAFYDRLLEYLLPGLKADEPILVMGDFNTAHLPIDLARPKQNKKTSGFLPEERETFDRYIQAGLRDVFREGQPEEGHYTWWSQRRGVREKNVGWRIDYVLASDAAARHLKSAKIHPNVMGSDHCPISVGLDPAVLGNLTGG